MLPSALADPRGPTPAFHVLGDDGLAAFLHGDVLVDDGDFLPTAPPQWSEGLNAHEERLPHASGCIREFRAFSVVRLHSIEIDRFLAVFVILMLFVSTALGDVVHGR